MIIKKKSFQITQQVPHKKVQLCYSVAHNVAVNFTHCAQI